MDHNQYTRGDVFYASLHKSVGNSLSTTKIIPVVVVSNDIHNTHSDILLVCPLTDVGDRYGYIHPHVKLEENNTLRTWYILTNQIQPLDKAAIGRYITTIRDLEVPYLDKALSKMIGINYPPNRPDISNHDEGSSKQISDLRSIVSKLSTDKENLEREIARLKELEKPAQLGMHVKKAFELLTEGLSIRHDNTKLATLEENISNKDQISSSPDQPGISTIDEVNAGSSTKSSDSAKEHTQPKVRITPHLSAVDRFNQRYEKYQKMLASRSADQPHDTTPVEGSNLQKSNPTLYPKLARSSARKWTDQKIFEFIADYPELPETDLLRKYELSSKATADRYYRTFVKNKSL